MNVQAKSKTVPIRDRHCWTSGVCYDSFAVTLPQSVHPLTEYVTGAVSFVFRPGDALGE
jgi:hypothetical protein